jgi:hypothetical protein
MTIGEPVSGFGTVPEEQPEALLDHLLPFLRPKAG